MSKQSRPVLIGKDAASIFFILIAPFLRKCNVTVEPLQNHARSALVLILIILLQQMIGKLHVELVYMMKRKKPKESVFQACEALAIFRDLRDAEGEE